MKARADAKGSHLNAARYYSLPRNLSLEGEEDMPNKFDEMMERLNNDLDSLRTKLQLENAKPTIWTKQQLQQFEILYNITVSLSNLIKLKG
jgi:hypothetical protein